MPDAHHNPEDSQSPLRDSREDGLNELTSPSRGHRPSHWKGHEEAKDSLLMGLREGFISEVRFFDAFRNIGVVLAEGATTGHFDKFDTTPALYEALKECLISPFGFHYARNNLQSRFMHYTTTDGSLIIIPCTCAQIDSGNDTETQYSLLLTPAALLIEDEVHEILESIPELAAGEYRVVPQRDTYKRYFLDVRDLPSEELAIRTCDALQRALTKHDVVIYEEEFYSVRTGRLERLVWGVTIYEKDAPFS
jgi:hypothetical protein